MKKVTKFLSLLLMLTLAIVFVSCGDPIEISFADESIEIEFEATKQLDFTVSDEELELEWSVSDPTILEVTQTGSVKGLKAGTTTVTVKVKGEDVEATISVTVKPKPVINPTTVVISDSVSEGKVGESYTFKATVLPAGADQGVTWASSDEEVATVSATGVVNLLSIGEVTISATSTKDNTKKQTVDINVLAPDPTSITITSEENVTEVNVFATLQFSASVSPDIAVAEVSWSVSDDALASIDANGKLTAKQPGTVTVTATSTVASTVSDTFELTIVQPDPEEVVVDKESATLEVDEEITLSANVLPSIAIQSVTFTSSDEDVATVDENGKVTAIGAGEAVITITATAKTSVTKTVNIKVIDVSLIEYDVEFVLLDEAITAERFEKITVDEKEFYVGLNAFTVASEAFAVLEDDSTLIVKKGTYSGATKVTASGVTILGPNAGKPAGKDLSNRVDEAVFSGVMTFDGAEDILIDGIAISGAAQIKFVKATKNVTIQNLNSFSPGIPAGEGVIFAQAATATDLNENFVIRNSSFVDSSGYDGAGPGGGFRAIRINNAKDLEITDNFLVGFYDTIRLEGEGNAGAGAGYGASGSIKINNNRFENNFQYPIWIGTHRLSDIEVFDNYLGTRKDYAGSGYGVYGYIYIVGFKPTAEFKAVVNVLRNEMPYQVPGWHQFRFNSGGATPEQLEINANFNIFHENASYPDGDYYHIADHFADSDTGFRINGKDNYFLYEGEVLEEYFLRTEYEPYFTELSDELKLAELVNEIPSQIMNDYELPTLDGVTWELKEGEDDTLFDVETGTLLRLPIEEEVIVVVATLNSATLEVELRFSIIVEGFEQYFYNTATAGGTFENQLTNAGFGGVSILVGGKQYFVGQKAYIPLTGEADNQVLTSAELRPHGSGAGGDEFYNLSLVNGTPTDYAGYATLYHNTSEFDLQFDVSLTYGRNNSAWAGYSKVVFSPQEDGTYKVNPQVGDTGTNEATNGIILTLKPGEMLLCPHTWDTGGSKLHPLEVLTADTILDIIYFKAVFETE
ncbi:MAG: Ig-like domain-containing protein [Bacilli bacterium]|nr:Ig-like domain-containing protein [Bacilli bacterium]